MDQPELSTSMKPADNFTERPAPVALLYYTDLMFGVQLQNIASKAGYLCKNVRPGTPIPAGSVMIVDLSARGDWREAILHARTHGIPVIAFGPHMNAEARKEARAAGATRVLANSNLARDLPGILREIIGAANYLNEVDVRGPRETEIVP